MTDQRAPLDREAKSALSEEMWHGVGASFGPVLREAFPDASSLERMAVGQALAQQVRMREHWFMGKDVARDEVSEQTKILKSVKEAIAEYAEDGFWRTCSGCHESEDGYDVGHYPFVEAFNCKLGGGCSECGGIGAIWDTTNYADMAKFMLDLDDEDEVSTGGDEDYQSRWRATEYSRLVERIRLNLINVPAPDVSEERAREIAAQVFDARARRATHPEVAALERNHAKVIRAGEGDDYDVVQGVRLAFAAQPATHEPTSPELVEIIRRWLMSTDHDISDWERQFAAAIESMMRAAGWKEPVAPPATVPEGEDLQPTWGNANTVGNFIAQLRTIDPAEPIFAGYHVPMDDGRMLSKVCGLHMSWEHVTGRNITGKKDEGVRTLVAWAGEPAPQPEPVASQGELTCNFYPACYLAGDCDFDGWKGDRCGLQKSLRAYMVPVASRTPPTGNAEGLREAVAKAIRDLATKEFGVGMRYSAGFMGLPTLNIYGQRATAAKWLMDNADAILALLPSIDGRREALEECARVAEQQKDPIEPFTRARDHLNAALRLTDSLLRPSSGDGEGRE